MNAISLKVTKLPIPVVTPFSGKAIAHPTNPPIDANSSDSSKKLDSMLAREKPSVRKTAISRARLETAEYMVFIAANPRQYVAPLSLSFVAKMFFILLACLNVFLFYVTGMKHAVDGVEGGQDAPLAAKVSAGVSLFLWVGVMYWGRVLQFFGNLQDRLIETESAFNANHQQVEGVG